MEPAPDPKNVNAYDQQFWKGCFTGAALTILFFVLLIAAAIVWLVKNPPFHQ